MFNIYKIDQKKKTQSVSIMTNQLHMLVIKESNNIQLQWKHIKYRKGEHFFINNERLKLQPSLDVDRIIVYNEYTILHTYDNRLHI